jgi:hypothetical protein
LVTVLYELIDCGREEGYAMLLNFDFFGDSDNHAINLHLV